jgi:hypothetical protein
MAAADANKLLRELRRAGWELLRRTKHAWLLQRGGRIIGVPTSPSDSRSLKNTRAQAKRGDE